MECIFKLFGRKIAAKYIKTTFANWSKREMQWDENVSISNSFNTLHLLDQFILILKQLNLVKYLVKCITYRV